MPVMHGSWPMLGVRRNRPGFGGRIGAAFEILKASYFRTSVVIARGLRPSGIEGKMTRLGGKSQLAIRWSGAWVRYLDHIA